MMIGAAVVERELCPRGGCLSSETRPFGSSAGESLRFGHFWSKRPETRSPERARAGGEITAGTDGVGGAFDGLCAPRTRRVSGFADSRFEEGRALDRVQGQKWGLWCFPPCAKAWSRVTREVSDPTLALATMTGPSELLHHTFGEGEESAKSPPHCIALLRPIYAPQTGDWVCRKSSGQLQKESICTHPRWCL